MIPDLLPFRFLVRKGPQTVTGVYSYLANTLSMARRAAPGMHGGGATQSSTGVGPPSKTGLDLPVGLALGVLAVLVLLLIGRIFFTRR